MFKLITFLFLLVFTVGCAGPKETEKVDPVDPMDVVKGEPKEPREMTPEEVAECPCGRADWSEPPPGYKAPK